MSHTLQPTSPTFRDALGTRLRWAILVSLLVNMALWRAAAGIARNPPRFDLRPVEITRVIIDNKGHKIEKVITKQTIRKRVAQIHKQIERVKPKPIPQRTKPAPPPPGAHHHVITAKPDPKGPPPNPDDHTALAGGNAELGKAIDAEKSGDAKTNDPTPVKETPKPAPEPVKETPKPAPEPVKEAPKPAPEPVKEAPKPAPEPAPVKPRGPTRDAEPDADSQVKPEIPDDLKHGDYSSFVRVRVEVAEDGTFTATIYKSSGNADIDDRVMKALQRWKWKPALRNGVPVASVQRFKFEFLVQ